MKKILATTENPAPAVLRIVAGLVLLAHGSQKLFGLFGGYGFTGTMNYFTGVVHLPWLLGLTVILIEVIGSVMLIFGILTRIVAFLVVLLMTGILYTVHLPNGFFMNWFGNQKGEGIEFFLLFIAIAASLVFTGGGRRSADRLFNPAIRTTFQGNANR